MTEPVVGIDQGPLAHFLYDGVEIIPNNGLIKAPVGRVYGFLPEVFGHHFPTLPFLVGELDGCGQVALFSGENGQPGEVAQPVQGLELLVGKVFELAKGAIGLEQVQVEGKGMLVEQVGPVLGEGSDGLVRPDFPEVVESGKPSGVFFRAEVKIAGDDPMTGGAGGDNGGEGGDEGGGERGRSFARRPRIGDEGDEFMVGPCRLAFDPAADELWVVRSEIPEPRTWPFPYVCLRSSSCQLSAHSIFTNRLKMANPNQLS